MKIAPELALRDALLAYITQHIENNLFTSLPPVNANVKYPFIELGSIHSMNDLTQSNMLNKVIVTINIWAKHDDDKSTYYLLNSISNLASAQFDCDGYRFTGMQDETDKQVVIDDSTGIPLNHGIVRLQFNMI